MRFVEQNLKEIFYYSTFFTISERERSLNCFKNLWINAIMALVNGIRRKYCDFFLYMFWSRLLVTPVKRGENLCSLKLHVAGWRQQAVAWLQSMVLPRALTARHCDAGPHSMNWLLDLDLQIEASAPSVKMLAKTQSRVSLGLLLQFWAFFFAAFQF